MRNRLNTMELQGGGDEDHPFLASPMRQQHRGQPEKEQDRSVPTRARTRRAAAAAAATTNAALVWICWAVRVVQETLQRCFFQVSSRWRGGGCSAVAGFNPAEHQEGGREHAAAGGAGESVRLFLPCSPGVLASLESGLGGDDPWRETWQQQDKPIMPVCALSFPSERQQQPRQQQEGTKTRRGGGEGEAGLLLPLPMAVSADKPPRELEANPSPCGTQEGSEDGGRKAASAGGATAPASPADFDHTAVPDAPSPAGADELLAITGGEGSCCGLCGYTLEEGQRVVRSPSCSEGLMLHQSCFDESEVVFSDEADGGRLKFGCDCGQFHPGLGLVDGVYALLSCAAEPSECSSAAGTPRSAAAWGGGRGFMAASPRQSLRQQQARLAALEACPVFLQADPLALAIVDGEVKMRPMAAMGATGAAGAAGTAADLHLHLHPDELATRFSRQDVLSRAEAGHLLRQGTAVLGEEDNVLELEGETVVVGDLHGQFFDLLNLLNTYGKPPGRQYLFLGDYVDRGRFSCEVALYLVALKAAYPRKVHLIRGNHETANQTASCGFKDECLSKYGPEIYAKFLECFSALPVCAILSQDGQKESLFCVHGGLSPRLRTVDDIRGLNRRVEPEEGTLLADLLWSDPSDDPSVKRAALPDHSNDSSSSSLGGATSPGGGVAAAVAAGGCDGKDNDAGFAPNLVRGCSWSYGWNAVDAFLKANGFRGILRAHSVQGEGYHHHFQGHRASSGTGEGVSTVFSAPMYTTHTNRGGVLLVRGDGRVDPLGYDAAPEPAVVNSAQAAVRRACPYMPASLADWARLSGAGQLPPPPPSPFAAAAVSGFGSPLASPFGSRRPIPPSPALASPRRSPFWRPQRLMFGPVFDEKEGLALRVLWEAMSGGSDTITANSLFAFDDSFGDSKDCLHAATVLKTLCPRVGGGRGGRGHDGAAATMYDFLRVAGALKTLAGVREVVP